MAENKSTTLKLFDRLWTSADVLRGSLPLNEFTSYMLAIFFFKFISDQWSETYEQHNTLLNNDPGAFLEVMKKERFVLPGGLGYEYVARVKRNKNLGSIINEVLHNIERSNSSRLAGIFSTVDFNDSRILGEGETKLDFLSHLIGVFEEYDFRSSAIDNKTTSELFTLLLDNFFFQAAKKGDAWSTPLSLTTLLATLMKPKVGDTVYDPACGTARLLIRTLQKSDGETSSRQLYGQEINSTVAIIARMNLLIHGLDDANLEWGDSLNSPKFLDRTDPLSLMKFDIVVSDPPIAVRNWWRGGPLFNYLDWGITPDTKGDYAFILHMLASASENKGRIGMIANHGVLFRKGVEADIRRKIIENNWLEAVISLPSNLFASTGIPVVILLFNKGPRENHDILFVDASRESGQDKRKNLLTEENIHHIVSTVEAFKTIPRKSRECIQDGYSYIASREEIEANDYNISVPRYVNTLITAKLDVDKTRAEIDMLDIKLAHIRGQLKQRSKDLGL